MKMQGPYWVYTHTCPNGMVYVGMSSQKETRFRWKPSYYKKSSLKPYIDEFGWDNISHFFIDGITTKESAMKLEDDLIQMYREKSLCINERGSGGWTLDRKEYYIKNKEKIKEYYEKNKEKLKEYQKRYYETHKI